MIRVGVIRAGIFGETHIDALAQWGKYPGNIELIGFAEMNRGRSEEMESRYGVRGYSDHRELIEKAKLDAVTGATPDHVHFKVVMDCLDAELPVLVEKPLTTDIGEASR